MKTLLLLIVAFFFGCSANVSNVSVEPQSVQETSIVRPELSDRIKFIENYVTFRRSYQELEYDITYHNNGGGAIPGPSDWDIKILAVVPETEVEDWIPKSVTSFEQQPPQWVTEIPGNISTTGITEWYQTGGGQIGVNRVTSTIAYRNSTIP